MLKVGNWRGLSAPENPLQAAFHSQPRLLLLLLKVSLSFTQTLFSLHTHHNTLAWYFYSCQCVQLHETAAYSASRAPPDHKPLLIRVWVSDSWLHVSDRHARIDLVKSWCYLSVTCMFLQVQHRDHSATV